MSEGITITVFYLLEREECYGLNLVSRCPSPGSARAPRESLSLLAQPHSLSPNMVPGEERASLVVRRATRGQTDQPGTGHPCCFHVRADGVLAGPAFSSGPSGPGGVCRKLRDLGRQGQGGVACVFLGQKRLCRTPDTRVWTAGVWSR